MTARRTASRPIVEKAPSSPFSSLKCTLAGRRNVNLTQSCCSRGPRTFTEVLAACVPYSRSKRRRRGPPGRSRWRHRLPLPHESCWAGTDCPKTRPRHVLRPILEPPACRLDRVSSGSGSGGGPEAGAVGKAGPHRHRPPASPPLRIGGPQDSPALIGEPAHQPIRRHRIGEPALRPAARQAGADHLWSDRPPLGVEQGKFAPGLVDAETQISRLGRGRRRGGRRARRWPFRTRRLDFVQRHHLAPGRPPGSTKTLRFASPRRRFVASRQGG